MIYTFEDFELDRETRELRRKGRVIHVEPRVFDVLAYLLENRARMVSRDELVDAVWDGRIVSDAAVSSCIRAARVAVADDGSAQRLIRTVHGHGFRFAPDGVAEQGGAPPIGAAPISPVHTQDIRFCHSADGTRIAYAISGDGPPLVKSSNWLTHLEYDWESPVWKHFFAALNRGHTLIRYDARGNGLSDWDVTDHSAGRQLEDLEAVINAASVDRFDMVGLSQGCMRCLTYAARHPERVRKLVLLGGYTTGWELRDDPEGSAYRRAAMGMIRHWWGQDNQAIRQLFTTMYMPDAPTEAQQWFSDLQRKTASPENAEAMMETNARDDVRPLLSKVRAPTLVIHARDDVAAPFEQGRDLAAGIRGARFASLETANHIMPESDPAWDRCAQLMTDFLADRE